MRRLKYMVEILTNMIRVEGKMALAAVSVSLMKNKKVNSIYLTLIKIHKLKLQNKRERSKLKSRQQKDKLG